MVLRQASVLKALMYSRVAGEEQGAASAAVGEDERTQGRAVFGAKSRHGSLQK